MYKCIKKVYKYSKKKTSDTLTRNNAPTATIITIAMLLLLLIAKAMIKLVMIMTTRIMIIFLE